MKDSEKEIKGLDKFKYRCSCWWSKDAKFGFIPMRECPVHGKGNPKWDKLEKKFVETKKEVKK